MLKRDYTIRCINEFRHVMFQALINTSLKTNKLIKPKQKLQKDLMNLEYIIKNVFDTTMYIRLCVKLDFFTEINRFAHV